MSGRDQSLDRFGFRDLDHRTPCSSAVESDDPSADNSSSKQKIRKKRKPNESPQIEADDKESNDSDLDIGKTLLEIKKQLNQQQKQLDSLIKKMVPEDKLKMIIRSEIEKFKSENEVRMNELEEKIKAVSHEKGDLEEKLQTALGRIDALENKNEENNRISKQGLIQANDNAQYSRRQNIRIHQLKDKQIDGRKLTDKELVCDLLNKKLMLNVTPLDIAAAHRVPTRKKTNDVAGAKKGEPDPMIVRFYDRGLKDKIMSLKANIPWGCEIIRDDLTSGNVGLINRASNHKDIKWSWFYNGKVFALTKDNYRIKLFLFCCIDEVINQQETIGFHVRPKFGPTRKRKEYVKKAAGEYFSDLLVLL